MAERIPRCSKAGEPPSASQGGVAGSTPPSVRGLNKLMRFQAAPARWELPNMSFMMDFGDLVA